MVSDHDVTADLMARLERHYIEPGRPFPGGVFIPECGWNGGARLSRADALYVGFTSTSGRLLVGHEVKASRPDWLRELEQSGKADAWADECHEWWIVAPSVAVVSPVELPAGWGLMIPGTSKKRMEVVKVATRHDRQPSWTAARSVMARLDTLRAVAIAEARLKAKDDADRTTRLQVAELVEQRVALIEANPAADLAIAHMAAIQDAIGMAVQDRASRHNLDNIGITELCGGIARYLRADRDVARAAADLVGRYSGLDVTRDRLDALRAALDALQDAVLSEPCMGSTSPV